MKAGVPCPPDIKRKLDRNNSRLLPSRRRDDKEEEEVEHHPHHPHTPHPPIPHNHHIQDIG